MSLRIPLISKQFCPVAQILMKTQIIPTRAIHQTNVSARRFILQDSMFPYPSEIFY